MLNRFEGKVIAIAGGSGGIGSSVAKRLASEGAAVLVGDINFPAAQQTAVEIAEAGGIATPMTLDIGDETSVQHFVAAATRLYGGLDGFHVNALDSSRAAGDTDAVAMDMADYDAMTAVNMRGYFLCTRHAVPALVARGGGGLLYTSSGSAYAGLDSRPAYSMIKSSIHALARHVASRWGKQGVRSNVIAPGLIMHPAAEAAVGADYGEKVLQGLPVTRLGKPEDIAAMAALLLSEDGAFITGQVISVDGGASMRP
ncbi:SDR family NAD(P)-dependent oxidoreductase [Haliea sp. E17]|uniref:SDR family NAD(P)-dependent oxidoreductase n=1 Tax=Haliea sp. E17 TaxID=3401576 RepID=UPI003AAD2FFF